MVDIQPDPDLVSVKETARRLGDITTWQVYKLLDANEIESRYLGKRRLVVMASLQRFIDSLPATRDAAS